MAILKISELPIMAEVFEPIDNPGCLPRGSVAQDVIHNPLANRILDLENQLSQAKNELAKTKTELRLAHGGEKNLRELKLHKTDSLAFNWAVLLSQEQLATVLGYPGAKVTIVRNEDMGHKIGLMLSFPADHPVAKGIDTPREWGRMHVKVPPSPLRTALLADDDPDFAEDLLFEVPKPELKAYRLNVDADLRKWHPTMIKVLDEQIHEVSGASAASWIADEQVPRGVIYDPHGVEQRRQIAALERKEEEPRQGSLGVVIHDPNGPLR